MSFKECQGLKALGAHLPPNFLLGAPPPPRRGLGLSITEVVFVWCSATNNVQKPVKCPQSIPKLNYFSLIFKTILLYLCLTLYRIKMLLP